MIRTRPGPERFRLGFSEAVQSAFGFLQQDYGFRCVEAGPTFVRYESDLAFVNLYHGRASYELGFEVGRRPDVRGQPESHYTMAEILQLAAEAPEQGRVAEGCVPKPYRGGPRAPPMRNNPNQPAGKRKDE